MTHPFEGGKMNDIGHWESPAKVNLRLEILRKREDGYHEIRTIFQKVSLYDRLHFFLNPRRGIQIEADHPNLPTGRKNLVYQAILSMLERSNYSGGVRVVIEKKIPLGAGLGGGSSNAATTLKALNHLLHLNLKQAELMEMGAQLGADVPFFLLDGSAIGTGIGEKLKRMTLPSFWYLLIYPNFEVSTRWAYQHSILTKTKYHINLRKLFEPPMGISDLLRNDLERGVSMKYPEIAFIKKLLLTSGAMGAMMTGSGPTVFGLFFREEEAAQAFQELKRRVRRRGWTMFQVHSLP